MSKLTFNKNFLTGSAMLLFTCALMLSGCNTVEGIGEDIEEAGEKTEDSASQQQISTKNSFNRRFFSTFHTGENRNDDLEIIPYHLFITRCYLKTIG